MLKVNYQYKNKLNYMYYNVLDAAIKQYWLPPLCLSCELSVVSITQSLRSRTILCALNVL